MEHKLSLKDCSLKDKKILIRVDFNVPMDAQGIITDDTRIKASIPTIKYVLDSGGSAILMSHLGRPKNGPEEKFSLKSCAERLSLLLDKKVGFAPDCIGLKVRALAAALKSGGVLLLENLRFHEGEENPTKDPSFVKELSELGDVYVNDAFGTAHRAHASTAAIAAYFPGKAAAGFLLEKEIKFLGGLLKNITRPFSTIIGGSKISSKIGILEALIKKADNLLVGGAMAYTFLKAQGYSIGDSLYEEDFLGKAKGLIELADEVGVQLYLPLDHVVIDANDSIAILSTQDGIPKGSKGVDIGPVTIMRYKEVLAKAKTILWNGPLGIFEDKRFAAGTMEIARELPLIPATTVIGGGDSILAVQNAGVADKITHLSTGGGASLEFLEFGTLPGIEALSNK